MKRDDEQLVAEYLSGNKTIFDEIVNRYLKSIYNFSYRLVGNDKEAEDITQEIFLKIWKNIKKFDTNKSFKTWIFTIAKNTTIDYLRKKKEIPLSAFDTDEGNNLVTDNLVDEELKPDEVFALSQNKIKVERVMDELTIIQKQVIILKYMDEFSLSEISMILKVPVDTVKSHHRRAIKKMEKILSAPKR